MNNALLEYLQIGIAALAGMVASGAAAAVVGRRRLRGHPQPA